MDQFNNDQGIDPEDNQTVPDDPYKELPVKDFSYINNPTSAPKKPKRWPLVLIVCLIIIVLAGGGAYLGLHHSNKAKVTATKTTTQSTKSNQSAFNSSNASSVATKTYTSTNYNLSVKYPTTWVVSDNASTSLNITSPAMNLTTANNKTVSGKIIVSVQSMGKIPTAFGSSAATAVLKSLLVSYSNPTQNQRAQTYVSFVQYAATTALGGLDGIYVTGNDGYQKAQNIPSSDLTGLDPLVTVSFVQCLDSSCTNPTSQTVSSSALNNSSVETMILNIIKSFSFN